MKETTVDKAQLQRIGNRYAEYRKSVDRGREDFLEELNRKAELKEERPTRRQSKPARLGPQRSAKGTLGKARKIHEKHAKRLARYAPLIQESAKRNNVPVELICGVMLQESGGRAKAVSHCGAKGLMQLMPATARRFGVQDVFDPQQNIEGGARYLRWLLDHFDGNVELALAGYNAGEHNVKKYGNKIPPFRETQAYVPAVLGYTQTMIDIFSAKLASASLPGYARRA